VRIWDAKSLKHVKTLNVSKAGCDHVAFTPDAKQIVTTGCGDDHAVRVWDVESGRQVKAFTGHKGHALCVAVTSDGKYALSSSSDATLRLWPLKGRK
jgi:WD40 repeat protein